jgi:hypothetical protein
MMIFVTGCNDKVHNSLCTDHKTLHQQHLDSVTTLLVQYTEGGNFTAQLSMPLAASSIALITDVSRVIQLEAQLNCQSLSPEVDEQSKRIEARYTFACGLDNKLDKVTVKIMENFPTVEEVEVWVETPAVNKHFVLNRQCERPIFNL